MTRDRRTADGGTADGATADGTTADGTTATPGERAAEGASTGDRRSAHGAETGGWQRAFVGRAVWAVFALLVVPLLAGVVDSRLWTPLALPGYLLMTFITVVSSALAPQYRFWVFWPPFVLASYGISVVTAAVYYVARDAFGGRSDRTGREESG